MGMMIGAMIVQPAVANSLDPVIATENTLPPSDN